MKQLVIDKKVAEKEKLELKRYIITIWIKELFLMKNTQFNIEDFSGDNLVKDGISSE